MDFLPLFLTAFAIQTVGVLSPGPAVAFLMGIGVDQGRRAALIATLGIAAGSSVVNVLTMLGVGALIQQTAWAMTVLRFVGAAYLAWLGLRALRNAIAPPAPITALETTRQSDRKLFAMGMGMQVTNPKAIMFWLAIAALGATNGVGWTLTVLFVVICFLISFFGHGGWALLLSADVLRRSYQRARRWIDGALGAVFVLFAVRLAAERS